LFFLFINENCLSCLPWVEHSNTRTLEHSNTRTFDHIGSWF
jgi:hypothetical protein